MTILQIGILAFIAIGIGQLRKGRESALLAFSAFVIYWLQPPQQFVSLAFWLPAATLGLTVILWALSSTPESLSWKQNWPAAMILAGVTILVALNRYFGLEQVYMTTTPPLLQVAVVVFILVGLAIALARSRAARPAVHWLALVGLIVLFILLKTPYFVNQLFGFVEAVRAGDAGSKQAILSWLGFSYVAFRLIHTIRDRQSGRLPSVTLGEYVNYVIFFPSFTAGPIDRIERFVLELRSPVSLAGQDWVEAGTRLFVGLFKKFVLADALAVIALNDILVTQVKSAGWMWFFLYAYSLRIYFDFSGYTDIAIGLARVLGIRLPENFAAPYLKPNLTQFWNSWHMTLTQWFRAYFFNPLTRAMRSSKISWPVPVIILITQVAAMVLIGLWHGVTWGFALWGLWHGLGLFVQNRWSEWARGKQPSWLQTRAGAMIFNAAGVFLTFNFVSLGWLFFTLSTPDLSWSAFQVLFGFAK